MCIESFVFLQCSILEFAEVIFDEVHFIDEFRQDDGCNAVHGGVNRDAL